MTKFISWAALSVAILANVVANLSLKQAVTSTSQASDSKLSMLIELLYLKSFWVGIIMAGVLFFSYILALKQISVSSAYVIVTSLAMALLIISERFILNTPVSSMKIFGVVLIITGVILVTKYS